MKSFLPSRPTASGLLSHGAADRATTRISTSNRLTEDQVGTEDLQRLTTDSAPDIQPRWSPDGLYIAFLRQTANDYGLYIIPSIGGTERQLTKLSLLPPIRFDVAQVNWSPDGKWLAVSDKPSAREPFSIFMVARDSGERRKLTSPSAEVNGDLSPAVSPDGKTVAYRHFESGGVSEIYLVPVAGGEPRRLTFSDGVKSSPAWTRMAATFSSYPKAVATSACGGCLQPAGHPSEWKQSGRQ